jgi:SNF2 family DNA or RNA helicase
LLSGERGNYNVQDSGKFQRLVTLAEEIGARGERILVFTQYAELVPALSQTLEKVFGRPGITIHGHTPVKTRQKNVLAFQEEKGPPFAVISLKAGGVGLTLTAASHVIHFDRWWNPAVEDQATDRAYRIGQVNNVMVHKFMTRGTVEERIVALVDEKRKLAIEVIGDGTSTLDFSKMSNEDILSLVKLDIRHAEFSEDEPDLA